MITVEGISTVEQYFFGQRKLDKIGVENLILNEKAILEMLINVQELVCCALLFSVSGTMMALRCAFLYKGRF